MWASSKFSFHSDLLVEVPMIMEVALGSTVEKKGKSGELTFVTLEYRLAREDTGHPVISEDRTVVYRAPPLAKRGPEDTGSTPSEAAAPATAGTQPTPPHDGPGVYTKNVTCGPVDLMRYSAVTFNSHRIHYDEPYATSVEGYPGIVVHGPLIASLLLDHATCSMAAERENARGGSTSPLVRGFNFRARAPVFANEALELCVHLPTGAVWAAKEGNGQVVLDGTVSC